MIRKVVFWLHLSAGVVSGLFIFIMAATGVILSFERQIVDFADRDVRSVTVPSDARPRPLNDLLNTVRHAGIGEPSAIVVRNEPQAATQFSIGRGKQFSWILTRVLSLARVRPARMISSSPWNGCIARWAHRSGLSLSATGWSEYRTFSLPP